MCSQLTISVIWVPGHREIVGNCIADDLARQGTTMPPRKGERRHAHGILQAEYKKKNNLKKLANIHWQNAPQCRTFHQTWSVINNKKNLGTTKIQPHRVCHADSRSYRPLARRPTCSQAKAPQNDFCRSCTDEEEEETVEHLLCFCPALCRLKR